MPIFFFPIPFPFLKNCSYVGHIPSSEKQEADGISGSSPLGDLRVLVSQVPIHLCSETEITQTKPATVRLPSPSRITSAPPPRGASGGFPFHDDQKERSIKIKI